MAPAPPSPSSPSKSPPLRRNLSPKPIRPPSDSPAGWGHWLSDGLYGSGSEKATGTPQVHSGRYHLQFDRSESLGYIVPHAVPPPAGWRVADGTCILLPLAEHDAASAQTRRDFCAHLEHIEPSLLLFLHRVQRLELVDELGGASRVLTRERDAKVAPLPPAPPSPPLLDLLLNPRAPPRQSADVVVLREARTVLHSHLLEDRAGARVPAASTRQSWRQP